jgi:hypothetical protein
VDGACARVAKSRLLIDKTAKVISPQADRGLSLFILQPRVRYEAKHKNRTHSTEVPAFVLTAYDTRRIIRNYQQSQPII